MTNRSPTSHDAEIGSRIRLARKQARLSQTELGQALGVTYQQVQKYENGTDRVAASRLIQIARFLKVSTASLLPDGDDEAVSALLGEDEIAALAAFRQIESEAMRQAGISMLKTLGAATRGDQPKRAARPRR